LSSTMTVSCVQSMKSCLSITKNFGFCSECLP
jgi:hypothetical protein